MRYAASTSVSAARSREEIENTVTRYGAGGFAYGWDDEGSELVAMISFRMSGKHIRFKLTLPDRNSSEFTRTKRGERKKDVALKAWEQACRQRWRALALAIKAKLEAIESGISTFEEEFLAFFLLPDGQTVGDFMVPQVEQAYLDAAMPRLLPNFGGKKKRRRAQ